jgi:hypothetical protein
LTLLSAYTAKVLSVGELMNAALAMPAGIFNPAATAVANVNVWIVLILTAISCLAFCCFDEPAGF